MRLFVVVVLIAVGYTRFHSADPDFSWLEGRWERLNMKSGRSGYEEWKRDGDRWVGEGVSLREGVVSFREELVLQRADGVMCYSSLVPENAGWVHFKITSFTDTSFVAENPKHDFPTIIRYELVSQDTLKAVVGNGDKTIEYLFKRQ